MPATKGERGHQRGPQIQLGRASEAFKRTDGLRRWRASDAAEKASEAAGRASKGAERASQLAEKARSS